MHVRYNKSEETMEGKFVLPFALCNFVIERIKPRFSKGNVLDQALR